MSNPHEGKWPARYAGPKGPSAPKVPGKPGYGVLAHAVRDADGFVPCLDRDEWTSDGKDDRSWAAAACGGCPVFALCADTASAVKPALGVYAGCDYTPEGNR